MVDFQFLLFFDFVLFVPILVDDLFRLLRILLYPKILTFPFIVYLLLYLFDSLAMLILHDFVFETDLAMLFLELLPA